MKKSNLIEIISALLILLFVYTAVSKLLDKRFVITLMTSPLIGNELARILVWALPSVEILISLLLFFPATRKLGLWASLSLMIFFTFYIGYLTYFAPHKPCNCGGVLKQMTWGQHFIFNIFFTVLAGIGLWLYRKIRLQNERKDIKKVIFT